MIEFDSFRYKFSSEVAFVSTELEDPGVCKFVGMAILHAPLAFIASCQVGGLFS